MLWLQLDVPTQCPFPWIPGFTDEWWLLIPDRSSYFFFDFFTAMTFKKKRFKMGEFNELINFYEIFMVFGVTHFCAAHIACCIPENFEKFIPIRDEGDKYRLFLLLNRNLCWSYLDFNILSFRWSSMLVHEQKLIT